MMNILKYTTLVSTIVIAIPIFYIVKSVKGFDPRRMTFSHSLSLLSSRFELLLFSSVFVIKSTADLIYSYYLVSRFDIGVSSIFFWLLFIYPILFLLGLYITESSNRFLHRMVVYPSGGIWLLLSVYISTFTENTTILILSLLQILLIGVIVYYYQYVKGVVNFYTQLLCVLVMWLWVLLFTILT